MKEIKAAIKESITAFAQGNLTRNSIALFKTLGYNTKRQSSLDQETYKGFKDAYLDGVARFNEDKALVSEWKYINLLFQLSKDEITTQHGLFDTKQVDRTIIETYLFFVIELSQERYSRTALSHITREINKVFPMPVMVLFRHGQALTLAVINRRLHKRDDQKDVLEKVTLIKDINIENPHRAHIEILYDLSFEELLRVRKFANFVELHNAWQKTLDIKELNKKFFKELSNWYFWAMKEVDFPGAALHADKKSLFKEEHKEKEHNAKNLIRLLTRLLFVWFVKEKGLIPEEFFDEKYVASELLVNFKPKKDRSGSPATVSCYYRAVLQNLFFATLNQTMGKREFRKSGQNMNVTNLMRYERYFKDPKRFLTMVEKVVPFMNGGLFECLDSPDQQKKGKQGGDIIIYLDGFSDREDNPLTVPDYIFFGMEDHVDLSEAYGDKAKEYKNAAVKGLINILKSYKFTVAENTPLEEEVALDPELLGQVFENLLASYNPETKTTARKQTGSFYTPREIVNYMVDESLLAYLQQKLEDAGMKDKEDHLRDLISYAENPNPFNTQETKQLIAAIDNCKIFDPACGSGAFPMGILHKLVHILHKLDLRNELWEKRQIEKALLQDDVTIREQLIADIESAFENNELDYGRKLYLIENCIYGVDIQPIATQISKLRFFISLIVDQKADAKKDNFGIRPLPNLETKFVAANTLIGIEKPKAQITFGSAEVKALEEQLKDVRHRLFSSKTPSTKRKLREEDKALREKMGDLLIKSGWENETARQLAGWDPYDQNTSSSFFDPEWMFGLTDGFDIAIGNPPYGAYFDNKIKQYLGKRYPIIKGQPESYEYFIYHSIHNLNRNSGGCFYIVPTNFIESKRAEGLRNYLLNNGQIKTLSNFRFNVWENNAAETLIFGFHKNHKGITRVLHPRDWDAFLVGEGIEDFDQKNWLDTPGKRFIIRSNLSFLKTLSENTISLGSITDVSQGIIVYKTRSDSEKNLYIANTKKGDGWERLLDSSSKIEAYRIHWGCKYLKYGHWLWCPREKKYFIEPKILFIRLRNKSLERKLIGAYDESGFYNRDNFNNIISKDKNYPIKFILCLFNSKLINYWYKSHFDNVNINPEQVRMIPIKKSEHQGLFVSLSDIASQTKLADSDNSSFFLRLIDAMVYELYFSKEIKSAGCEVLKYLDKLPGLKDDWSDEKKLATIEKIYKEFSDPKHPVSIAMAKMQEVPEVKIIEGRNK